MTNEQAIAILEAERVLQFDTGNLVMPDGPEHLPGSAWNGYVIDALWTICDDDALMREFADIPFPEDNDGRRA